MSSVTNYFERMQRNAYQNPRSQRHMIWLGIFLLTLGAIVATARHDFSRARFPFALGITALFCGVTEETLRGSKWRWATRLIAFGMWCAVFYLTVRF